MIDLTDGFVTYQEKPRARSPQFCGDLARRTRKLEREAGELSFVADSRDPAELRTLMAWKSPERHKQTLKSHDLCVTEGMVTQGGVARGRAPGPRRYRRMGRAADQAPPESVPRR